MLVTVYEAHWMRAATGLVQIDPTRMAQGIMTGIGFLGAGVIIKEGLSVRGLTTAASIWITAAIGILAGIGFYFPLDRKSTRLNSSHLGSSYAVFCLKKKKLRSPMRAAPATAH